MGLEELRDTMSTQAAVSVGTQMKILALLVLNPVARGCRPLALASARGPLAALKSSEPCSSEFQ